MAATLTKKRPRSGRAKVGQRVERSSSLIVPQAKLRLRALPEVGEGAVEGLITVYNVVYDIGWGWQEQILPGCFDDSIARNATLPLFWEHMWEDCPIGAGTAKAVDEGVMLTNGQLYIDDPAVRRVWRSMADGAISEWSVAYYPQVIQIDPDQPMIDSIAKGELIEATICVRGANPETETTEVRSKPRRRQADDGDPDDDPGAIAQAIDATNDELAEALEEGDVESAKALCAAIDLAVDHLLDLYGVPDPGDDDEPDDDAAEVTAASADLDAVFASLANPSTRAQLRECFPSSAPPSSGS